MAELLFVINPLSGKGQIKNNLLGITDIFTNAGFNVTVRPTQTRLDAYDYVKNNAYKYDRIIVSGGDGTLNEVVNGLMDSKAVKKPYVGYIPSGTTNDFASTLKIPKNMLQAAEAAAGDKTIVCDVGRFNGRYFNYVAAFGAFTDVSYDTPQEVKNAIGHAAYVFEGIKRLASLPSYRVKIKHDCGEIDETVFLCLILNSTSIGGVINTEKLITTKLNDGVFEMLLLKQPANITQLQQVIGALAMGNASNESCIALHSKRFEISCDEQIKWTLDGEFGGDASEAVIDVIPSAITYALDLSGAEE